MSLESTQSLTEMSSSNISWGVKAAGAGLTTLPPSCAYVLISESLKLLEPSRSVQACAGISICFRIGSSSARKFFP